MSDAPVVRGDHVSCSRLGGSLRRHAARLTDRRDLLERLAADLPHTVDAAQVRDRLAQSLELMQAAADDLDRAGALVQRYATDLAEIHELGRRVERSVLAAGLELEAGRVVEPWGLAHSAVAQRRREVAPDLQARVDRVIGQAGRARGGFARAGTELTRAFATHSRELRGIPASGGGWP